MKWKSINSLAFAFLWPLLLLCSTAVKADYWLVTVNLDDPQPTEYYGYPVLQVRRFISSFDCQGHGQHNVDLLKAVGVRAGFACINDEEREDAKEDTPVPELP